MLNESLTEPPSESHRSAPPHAPPPTVAPLPTVKGQLAVDEPGTNTPEEGARSPAEYTETPGSHRRPSDGAALDVGA